MKTTISYFFFTVLFSFLMFTVSAQISYKSSKEYGRINGKAHPKFYKNYALPYGKVKSQLSNISKIRSIAISYNLTANGRGIEQIGVGWKGLKGQKYFQKAMPKKGKVKYIYLDYDEYITKVTGYASPILTSITFYTNKGKRYGPFGKKPLRKSTPFKIMVPYGSQVIGFSGKVDRSGIRSIGLIYRVHGQKARIAKRKTTMKKRRTQKP